VRLFNLEDEDHTNSQSVCPRFLVLPVDGLEGVQLEVSEDLETSEYRHKMYLETGQLVRGSLSSLSNLL
jgi:hypothetical protein